jgi:hypothetical protein
MNHADVMPFQGRRRNVSLSEGGCDPKRASLSSLIPSPYVTHIGMPAPAPDGKKLYRPGKP